MKKLFYVLFCGAMLAGLTACEDTKKKDKGDGGSDGGTTTTEVKAVDLGLESGTLWADRNLGAASETGYGNYYAWGETAQKSNYTWSAEGGYAWGIPNENDLNYGMTKYNNTDSKYQLEAADDAATVTLQGSWRTPTDEETEELLEVCDWEFTYKNKVAGWKVTGLNGNNIFLPLAGYKADKETFEVGAFAVYWTSNIEPTDPTLAMIMEMDSTFQGLDDCPRCFGLPIRPVTAGESADNPDDPKNPEGTPEIAAPGAGYITLALSIPENTCNGLYAVGTMNGWDVTDYYSYRLGQVPGTTSWYFVKVPYTAALELKVIAIPADESLMGWEYQWARNSVTLLNGNAENLSQNNGEPQLANFVEGSVVYATVDAWATDPCGSGNGGGNSGTEFSFNYAEAYYYPAYGNNFTLRLGNVSENSWNAPLVDLDIYTASANSLVGYYYPSNSSIGLSYSGYYPTNSTYYFLTDAELHVTYDGLYEGYYNVYTLSGRFEAENTEYTFNNQLIINAYQPLDTNGDGEVDSYDPVELETGSYSAPAKAPKVVYYPMRNMQPMSTNYINLLRR